jgi:hypothetical protein
VGGAGLSLRLIRINGIETPFGFHPPGTARTFLYYFSLNCERVHEHWSEEIETDGVANTDRMNGSHEVISSSPNRF